MPAWTTTASDHSAADLSSTKKKKGFYRRDVVANRLRIADQTEQRSRGNLFSFVVFVFHLYVKRGAFDAQVYRRDVVLATIASHVDDEMRYMRVRACVCFMCIQFVVRGRARVLGAFSSRFSVVNKRRVSSPLRNATSFFTPFWSCRIFFYYEVMCSSRIFKKLEHFFLSCNVNELRFHFYLKMLKTTFV